MKLLEIEGKKVVDAKNKMILVIGHEDVAKGNKKAPNSCAAALALTRQMDAISARVHLSRVYVEYPKRWVRYKTPHALRMEIVSFDRGHKFETGEYTLSPLSPSETPNGKKQSHSTKVNKPKRPRAKQHNIKDVRTMAHYFDKHD